MHIQEKNNSYLRIEWKVLSHKKFLTYTFIFCCEFDLEQDFTDNYTLPTINFK